MYKRRNSTYRSPSVDSTPKRVDVVTSVDEQGNESMVVTCAEHKNDPLDYSEARKATDLQTLLRAGVNPKEVDCMMRPQTGESAMQYSERAHGVLSDIIVNAESQIKKNIENIETPNPPTNEES